jgi:hypothetical protein
MSSFCRSSNGGASFPPDLRGRMSYAPSFLEGQANQPLAFQFVALSDE